MDRKQILIRVHPRYDTAGRPTKQAHWGKIYQATNCSILRPVPHPGCLAFAFALRPAARARLVAYHGMPRLYPRPTTAEA